jgi:hypothetical protein
MSLFVHSLHCGPLGEESCVFFSLNALPYHLSIVLLSYFLFDVCAHVWLDSFKKFEHELRMVHKLYIMNWYINNLKDIGRCSFPYERVVLNESFFYLGLIKFPLIMSLRILLVHKQS